MCKPVRRCLSLYLLMSKPGPLLQTLMRVSFSLVSTVMVSCFCPGWFFRPCRMAFSVSICTSIEGIWMPSSTVLSGVSSVNSKSSPMSLRSISTYWLTKSSSSARLTLLLLLKSRFERISRAIMSSFSVSWSLVLVMLELSTLNTKWGDMRCRALASRSITMSMWFCMRRLRS